MTPVHLELKNALNSLDTHSELTNAAAKVSELASDIPILRLRRRPGGDCCQSALWDCLGDKFVAMLKMRPPKQSHNALDNHLDQVSGATSKWRIVSNNFVVL